MDILNWLYLAKNKFVRTTPGSEKDLMIFGAKVGTSKRGDLYQNYAMSIEDLGTQIGGLQTVAVDGVTITGDGTLGDPLVASVPTPTQSYKVYTAILTQSGTAAPVATVLDNPDGLVITFSRNSAGSYSIQSTSFIRGKVIINNLNPYIDASWEITDTAVNFPKITMGGGPPSTYREIILPSSMHTTGTNIDFSTFQASAYSDGVLSKYNLFIEIRVYN